MREKLTVTRAMSASPEAMRIEMTDGRVTLSWFVTYDRKPDAPPDIAATMTKIYEVAMLKIDECTHEP